MTEPEADISALMDRCLALEAMVARFGVQLIELQQGAMTHSAKIGELEQRQLSDHDILADVVATAQPRRRLWGMR